LQRNYTRSWFYPGRLTTILFLNFFSANEELPWTSVDAQFLKSCSVRGAVTEEMKCIIQATSHYAVSLSVNRLSMHFLAENSVKAEQKIEEESRGNLARHVFYSCDWRTAFER
jgi:hypothetical protein